MTLQRIGTWWCERRRINGALAIIACAGAVAYGCLVAPPAHAAASPATGPISSVYLAGKCVDDLGGSSANGTIVDLWGCNGAAQYQSWTIEPDGTVRINGKCLDIKNFGTSDGSKVQLWDCSGASNQQWQASGFDLRNPASNRCLYAPSTTNGTQLEIWDCTGRAGEIWDFPGGMVASIDDGGVNPNLVNQAIQTYWPEGLRASAGSTLDSLIHRAYSQSGGDAGAPAPPSTPAALATVSGSIITIHVPANEVAVVAQAWPNWLAALTATFLGGAAALVVVSLCLASVAVPGPGQVLAPWIVQTCSAIAGFFYGFVYYVSFYFLNGTPFDAEAWKTIFAGSLAGAAVGAGLGFVTAKFAQLLPGLLQRVGIAIAKAVYNFGVWLGSGVAALYNALKNALQNAAGPSVTAVYSYAAQHGMATLVPPVEQIRSLYAQNMCVDNYGGTANPGAVVDLWGCNNSPPNQFWEFWSNGMITIDGNCLNTYGYGTGNGTKLQLWDCNGNAAEQWQWRPYAGSSSGPQDGILVNVASNKCLDDTNFSQTNGTVLQIWDCSGGANQNWARP